MEPIHVAIRLRQSLDRQRRSALRLRGDGRRRRGRRGSERSHAQHGRGADLVGPLPGLELDDRRTPVGGSLPPRVTRHRHQGRGPDLQRPHGQDVDHVCVVLLGLREDSPCRESVAAPAGWLAVGGGASTNDATPGFSPPRPPSFDRSIRVSSTSAAGPRGGRLAGQVQGPRGFGSRLGRGTARPHRPRAHHLRPSLSRGRRGVGGHVVCRPASLGVGDGRSRHVCAHRRRRLRRLGALRLGGEPLGRFSPYRTLPEPRSPARTTPSFHPPRSPPTPWGPGWS
jgi:hypothetical protein